MANGGPNDDKKFLNIPGWIWDKMFYAISLSVATAVVSYFSHATKTAVEVNGEAQAKHSEKELAKQDEVKTAVTGVKQEVAKVTEATQAIPVAAAEAAVKVADKVIEQKAADAKGPEQ